MKKPEQRMLLKCTETGKFIKLNIDEIRAGVEGAPIWVMVDNEEDATHDPGWVGEDQTMMMIMYCKEHYGCGSFTTHTPKADGEAMAEYEVRQATEKLDEILGETVVIGGASAATRAAMLALATSNKVVLVDSLTSHPDHELSLADVAVAMSDVHFADFDGDRMLFPKECRIPKQKGYQPNRKQQRAMNRQANRRAGRRR
tara:strand:+ start:41449 stop:42048 length:600 start_codon:yes stop_codon:yes gene_type:complete